MKIIANKEKNHIKKNLKLKKYWDFDALNIDFNSNEINRSYYSSKYKIDFIKSVMNDLNFVLIEDIDGLNLRELKNYRKLKYLHHDSGVFLTFSAEIVNNEEIYFEDCLINIQVNKKSSALFSLYFPHLDGFGSSGYLNSKFNDIRVLYKDISFKDIIYNLNNIQNNCCLLPFEEQEIVDEEFIDVIDLKNYNLDKNVLFRGELNETELTELKKCYIENINELKSTDNKVDEFLLKMEVLKYDSNFNEKQHEFDFKNFVKNYFKENNYLSDRFNRVYLNLTEEEIDKKFNFLIYESFIYYTIRDFNFNQLIFENSSNDINKIKHWFKKININSDKYLINDFNYLLDQFKILLKQNDPILDDKLENGCGFIDFLISLDNYVFKVDFKDPKIPESSFVLEYLKSINETKMTQLCTEPNCLGDTLPLRLLNFVFQSDRNSLISLKYQSIIELMNSKFPMDKWNIGKIEDNEIKTNSVLGVFANRISNYDGSFYTFKFKEKITILNDVIDLYKKHNINIGDTAFFKKRVTVGKFINVENNKQLKLEDFSTLLEEQSNDEIVNKEIYLLSLKLDEDVNKEIELKQTKSKRKM